MKTQNNKLVFSKNSILELQSTELNSINGGSGILGGPTCSGCNCINVSVVVGNPGKNGPIAMEENNNNQVM